MVIEPKEELRIRAAITEAETKTSGEIFCVVARSSGSYTAFPAIWAAIVALSLPLLLLELSWSASDIHLAQLIVFLALFGALSLEKVKLLIVPGAIKRRHAHRNAASQFLAHGLHTTQSRTGVLLFVSLAERYAEVIADQMIDSKVTPGFWEETVAELIAGAKAGKLGDGFVKAVAKAGDALAEFVPPDSNQSNELPDHLVIL